MSSSTQVIIPSGDFSLETTMALALLKFVLGEYTIVTLDETDSQFSQYLHSYKHISSALILGMGGQYVPQQRTFHWSSHANFNSQNNNKRRNKIGGKKSLNESPASNPVYFNNSRRCKIVPLATVGLVYRFYGKEIIKKITGFTDSTKIDWLYERAYFDFIEIIDAYARNLSFYHKNPSSLSAVPKFNADQHTLPNLVKFYNLQLHDYETLSYDEVQINTLRMTRLETVVKILNSAFENYVKYFAFSFMQGERKVQKAYDESLSGETFQKYYNKEMPLAAVDNIQNALHRIIIMTEFIPWKEHLFAYEKKLDKIGNSLYAIFPDSSRNWRLAAVPTQPSSFESRKKLPQQWCGLTDDELRKVCEVDDATFVHSQGFIAGADSLAGCLQLAIKAVQDENDN